jgi:C4-dicarboxylate transporter, DctM subunit
MITLISLSFFTFLFAGVPIAFVMGLTSFVCLLKMQSVPFKVISVQMFAGIDSFPYLAIPFFMLAGELMNAGGITSRLVIFSRVLVGRISGALAYVNIISSIFFAGITGAAVADTAAIGSILIPAMKEEGYKSSFACAVTAASSCIGPIIPPSLIMVVYGVTAGESIGALFLCGFLPGVTMGLLLMFTVWIIGLKHPLPKKTTGASEPKFLKSMKDATISLLMPIIIIGGILSGLFTPTEAAAVAVVYALVVGFLVFKELKFNMLPKLFVDAGVTSAMVLLIASCANVFSLLLSTQQVPQLISDFMLSISQNKMIILFLINILLLLVGCFLETSAAILILTPILLPLATDVGINALHFGVIMVLNLTIGLATPPVGVCLFVACAVGGVTLEELSRAIWPFILSNILVLIIFILFPEMSLWLPRVFGYI